MPQELVQELEQDELEDYSDKVKTRLKQMKKVWHDERRAKEAAFRERQAAEEFARKVFEENKKLKETSAGLGGLILGGNMVVNNAVRLARMFHVGETFIGSAARPEEDAPLYAVVQNHTDSSLSGIFVWRDLLDCLFLFLYPARRHIGKESR